MCLCDIIKIALLTMKSVFINVKKDMSELGAWLTAKHTANVLWRKGITKIEGALL